MKKNLLFRLAYWYQSVIVCPLLHGRQAAHSDHVQREREAAYKELQVKFGENLERMPQTQNQAPAFYVVGGQGFDSASAPDADAGVLGNGKIDLSKLN